MSNRHIRRQQQKALRKKGGGQALVTADNLPSAMQAAVQYHHQGKFRQAGKLYQQVLDIDPNHLDALNGMAMIAYEAKRYDRADS